MTGRDGEEKRAAGEVRLRGGFISWLDNFWYHYKWQTLGVAFLLVVVIFIALQMTGKTTYEFSFVYAGPYDVSRADEAKMEKRLSELADSTEFPSPDVRVSSYFLMTQDQIARFQSDAANEGFTLNLGLISSNRDTFDSEVRSGEAILFFLDPEWFEKAQTDGAGFLPIETYVESIPDGALYSDCAIYLRSTLLAEEEGFSSLPDDTVLCIRSASSFMNIFREEEARAYHLRYEELLRRLIPTTAD